MKTSLYQKHVAASGRIVDFAGWEMPVQYAGILDEHRAVREACGVFDISHMGEFFVRGPGACQWLESLLASRVSALEPGAAQYSFLLNPRGGVIDDLYVYCLAADEYLLVVNAAKIDEDAAWMRSHAVPGVDFEDASTSLSAIAVQGPRSTDIFKTCFGRDLPPARNRVLKIRRGGQFSYVATTGYTGETGFEVVCPNAQAESLWDAVTAVGARPCGLGARDVLRLEMCYPLNGSDLSPEHTPLEAGLGYFVDLEKGDFIGRDALVAQKAAGVPSRLCALVVREKSPPMRSHYTVAQDGRPVGETTSGGLSPSLGAAIALARLDPACAAPGTRLEIDVRGRQYPAEVVRKPFLKKSL